jgi:hypothetical protein
MMPRVHAQLVMRQLSASAARKIRICLRTPASDDGLFAVTGDALSSLLVIFFWISERTGQQILQYFTNSQINVRKNKCKCFIQNPADDIVFFEFQFFRSTRAREVLQMNLTS